MNLNFLSLIPKMKPTPIIEMPASIEIQSIDGFGVDIGGIIRGDESALFSFYHLPPSAVKKKPPRRVNSLGGLV